MFFRNLTLFRFSPAVADDLDGLAAAAESHRLRPCGPLEMTTRGFVPPVALGEDPALVRDLGTGVLFAVGREDKLLPAAVVNQELVRKVATVSHDEGRPVSGRERRRLKAEILDQLLPRAFAQPSSVLGYVDRKQGWLVLDTASRKAAEDAVSVVRDALGSFPALPPTPGVAPRERMTAWIAGDALPDGLALGDECELRDAAANGAAIVRCRHQVLEGSEIAEHLRNGKQAFQLGLSFDDRIGFVLGEDLVIRKLRFFDVVSDELDTTSEDDAAAEQDAQWALMMGEIAPLLGRLETWFGLARPTDN